MKNCKLCNSSELVKNGKNNLGAQRYKCKSYGITYVEGDARFEYRLEKKKLKLIKMYLEGMR